MESSPVSNGIPEGGNPEGATSQIPKTTTISTIAVQSGKTRLVIALLQSGDWVQLKILEVEPELTKLGATLSEALDLQKAHDGVLQQLQNKQSPVEELLRQADHLISHQRPRAEVYAAMADSLGRAWNDVNQHLELRKQILDLNVLYQRRAEEFYDKVDILEASCKDTMIPIEIEAVKDFLTNIHDQRRAVLETLMSALQAGNQLLGKLKELGIDATLDSRPERIRASVNRAISQVEKWLDDLHVKRQYLEISWQTRKTQLEQCLALAMLARDLRELDDTVSGCRESLANSDHLGDSSSSAELLHHEHKKLIPEARQLQERAIKITKATEQLVNAGCFAGEEATSQAYNVLEATSDYLADLETRDNLLQRTITFFRNANTALTKLDQLEVQLTITELPSTSPQLVQLHSQCAKAIEDTTQSPLQEGHQLLNDAGRGHLSTDGVKRMVEELENRKIFLENLCIAHREENIKISQALTTFLEKHTELYSWLIKIAEAFLQGHQDMGGNLSMAKDFLDLHNQLLNDLQTKGNEINSLLLTLPPILEYLDDAQRRDVDNKVESLHEHWLKLKNILELRLDLAAVYVRFHTEAETVNNAMNDLENTLKNASPDVRDNFVEQLEERWSTLVPLYQQAKNTGLNFISQSVKVSEPHLDTKRACLCVESVLERLQGRQIVVSRNWQSFQSVLTEHRELIVQWERTMTESSQTIDWVSRLEAQLYPIITTPSTNPIVISSELKQKLISVLDEIKRAQTEVEQRLKTAESLTQKVQPKVDETSTIIKRKLTELNQKLIQIITEYEVLLEMLISHFHSLTNLDKSLDTAKEQYNTARLPTDTYEVEAMIREHERSRQAVLEMFRYTQNDSEKIITRIRKQEPPNAADHDIQKLFTTLETLKKEWEPSWNQRKDNLDQHNQLCQFNTDLHHINETLDGLGLQLDGIKGQYGETIDSANATSVAFLNFEKTIELLEQRIQVFVGTGEQLLAERHGQSPHIERELNRLKNRWRQFKMQVAETRRLIDLSIKYFQLVDEADEWFREGSRLLVIIARKSTSVKRPEEATKLLEEIQLFLRPGEDKQNERIRKITALAVEIYGIEQSKQVNKVLIENREMLDSFTTISNELNTLARNLKAAELERDRQKREQEIADANLAAMRAAAQAAEEARITAEIAAEKLREAAAEEARRAAEREAEQQRQAALEQARKAAELEAEKQRKAAAEEAVRIAELEAQKLRRAAAEEARRAAELLEAEKARIAAELREAEEARRAAELREIEARHAAELRQAEENRRAAELRAAEEARRAAEQREEEAKQAAALREAEAKRAAELRAAEDARRAAELREAEEAKRIAALHEAEARRVAELRQAEERRIVELREAEARRVAELQQAENARKAAELRAAEEARRAAQIRDTEEARMTAELRVAEEARMVAELRAAEEARKADELRAAEDARRAAELRAAEEARKAAELRAAEEARKAEELRAAEEIKRIADLRAAEEAKKAEELRAAEEARRIAELRAAEEARRAAERRAEEEAKKFAELRAVEEARRISELHKSEKIEVVHIIKTEVQPLKPRESDESKVPEEKIIEVMEQVPPPRAPDFIIPLTDAVIEEGSRFTFECQVVGHPLPVVTWFKDGISIQNNPDYQTTFDQGHCTLTIEETFTEDSARYTCKAINAAGIAETAAVLSVKETEPEEVLIPPSFTKVLEPAVAKEGTTFTFECTVEGNPLPTVQWFKNYECIDNSPDFVITYNNGEALLKFEEVFLEDKAEYTCKATNELGTAQSTASLSIEPLEPTIAPEFTVPLSNIMARTGQKIKLECEVTGLPEPTLTWSHNGKQLKESRDLKLQYDNVDDDGNNRRATVVISEAFPKDAGTYQVTAVNLAGEAISACNVSVKGRIPQETSDSEQASDMEPIKPSIQLGLKDLSVFEGRKVRLDCIIVGQPEPEVIWYHNERPVKESTDFQLLFQGDRCSLVIQEALTEDAGEYKVIAINSAGEASSKCNMTVTPVVQSQPVIKPIEEKLATFGTPPKFTKLLTDVLVSESDRIVLECTVIGDPTPEIKWLLNNQEIKQQDDHFKFSQDSENNVKLEIEHVKPEDKGVYTVKASNVCGDAKCFAQLIVKSLRVTESPRRVHEEPKIAPAFKELFSDRSCFENQTTKFECIVTGKPTPKIKWLFNGVAVSGKDYLVSTSGERQVLAIPNVTTKNQGKISCIAENEIGKSTCEAYLSVEPTGIVTFPDQSTETSYSMKREVFVQSSSTSSSKIITSAGAEPQVQVHSVSSQGEHSFKQINQQAPEIKESHKIEEFHQINKDAPIISEKSYKSFTTNGQEQTGGKLIIHRPTRKTMPPRFVTPVVGKIVDQGVDVTLEGILDGYPAPEVTWMKNGHKLESSDGVQISYELNHAKLVLKSVTVKDAGKYTCTGTNEAGSAVSTTDLVVKKTIFPPVFGRRLQAQVIKKGDRLIMEVEVTGTPEPTITWFKDDQPLESALKEGYRTKMQGNCHTLIIDKALMTHTGKYMVRAVNSGGETQSIADIAVFEPTPETMVEMVKTVVFEDVQKHENLSTADQTKSTISTKSTPITTRDKIIPVTQIPEVSTKLYPSHSPSFESTQFSSVTENRVSQSVTKFKLEHTTPDIPKLKPFQGKPIETEIPVEKEIPIFIEPATPKQEETTLEGIETGSISKKSSLDFFESRLKQPEEPVLAKVVEIQKIPADIFTKFEDHSVSKTPDSFTSHDIKSEVQSKTDGATHMYSSSSSQEYKQYTTTQSELFQEFNLTPEPPPEMGFIPKTESIQKREDVTVRIKKLEDSHRDLSPLDVPLGGVKIFPTPSPKLIEEPIFRSQAPIATRPLSPRPSAEAVHMEKLWTPQPTLLPDLPEVIRGPSPKPSPQGLAMEKLWTQKSEQKTLSHSVEPSLQGKSMEKMWAHKHTDSHIKGVWPPPQTEESPVPKTVCTIEKSWPPTETKTETLVKESFSQELRSSTIEKSTPIHQPVTVSIPETKIEQSSITKLHEFRSVQPPTPVLTETVIKAPEPVFKPVPIPEQVQKIETTSSVLKDFRSVQPPLRSVIEPAKEQKFEQSSVSKTQEFRSIQPIFKPTSVMESKTESFTKESSSSYSKTQEFRSFQVPQDTPVYKPIPIDIPPSIPVQHYIAEATVSHKVNIPSSSVTKTEKHQLITTQQENIIEEHQAKASEIIKSWPPVLPKDDFGLKAPQMVKDTVPKIESIIRPISVQDITDEVYLEPGPPPEMGYAEAPRERRQSYVEIIEQDLEKNLDKVPSRVLPGSVRTIPPPREKSLPPPLPPKKEQQLPAPPVPAKPIKIEQKKTSDFEPAPFEKFPDLQPFPFKPDTATTKSPKLPPPPTPSKFIKGRFGDSDYESDFESIRIAPKWKPCQSDTEELSFKKVKPPKLSPITRSRSTDPEPLPPSKFDQPPQFHGPPRPAVDLETTKRELKKEVSVKQVSKTTKKVQKIQPLPELKPGSPPVYVETPKADSPKIKPGSPKTKQKVFQESGYMADTDEPLTLTRKSTKVEHHQSSKMIETKQISQSYETQQRVDTRSTISSIPQTPPKIIHHKYENKKHVSSSTGIKKDLVAPVVSVTSQKTFHHQQQETNLEPFPFTPEPVRTNKVRGPPPPSPSKFVKGDFKESDYESDYEGRIPPVWRANESDQDFTYKPVRPVLTPSSQLRSTGRTPTPPTEFDQPPQIEYPLRPKFEPIEKHKQTVKLDEILKTTAQKTQTVFKPKPVPAKQAMELIIATPAERVLKPGSPPEMFYAPETKKTQYYRSVTGIPLHNATQTETSNVMHFNESTEKSHRVVSVQQTTRVIKFGDQQSEKQLEPFPFKAEPVRPKRTSVPPPPKPKKFVPGEFRESDYESEVENARIKPKWVPGYSEDEPHYRKVKPPPPGRCSSVPTIQRVVTPMEFDTTQVISRDVVDRNRYSSEIQSSRSYKKTQEIDLQPGTPPEYAFSPVTVPVKKATEIASQHMEDMTHTFKSKAQKFVNDIMTDVKQPQKPILKTAGETDSDAQAYREESRIAQYGTKHIDPDTGLIYFKYDFGYEFGVILPGESKNGISEIPQPKKTVIQPPKRASDIELPVYHETTQKPSQNGSGKIPQFRPKQFTSQTGKNVKWEPTSESEMSEIEGEMYKKRHSLPNEQSKLTAPRWEQHSTSPMSISPSLPSMSPAFAGGSSWTSPGKQNNRGRDTPPSTPSTPGSMHHPNINSAQPKRAPMFITPLRDIAVMSGQTARFECIVQSEPPPSMLWSKNGRIIQNSNDYQLQYRNGVCRLTIPQAYPEDAGTYCCTATNQIGAVNTTATLQVPGERRSSYI